MRAATIRQCAILAGGLGTRLGGLTTSRPKPVLPVAGRPFLAWLMRELQRFGVEEFIVLSGHLSSVLEASIREIEAGLPKAARIVIAEEPVRAGTGGALSFAREQLAERFLLCNGNSIFDINLAKLLCASARAGSAEIGRLAVREVDDVERFGVVELAGERITRFVERGAPSGTGLINGGVYVLDRRVLDLIPGICSLERDVLPRLAAEGALGATQATVTSSTSVCPKHLPAPRSSFPGGSTGRRSFSTGTE